MSQSNTYYAGYHYYKQLISRLWANEAAIMWAIVGRLWVNHKSSLQVLVQSNS